MNHSSHYMTFSMRCGGLDNDVARGEGSSER